MIPKFPEVKTMHIEFLASDFLYSQSVEDPILST